MRTLAEVAREPDRAVSAARHRLVQAIREASAQGMTQQQIARETGRSQPEISRLLRFHGSSPLGRRLRAHRADVIALIEAAGGSDVRDFGSVAEGQDGGDSDADLLFTMDDALASWGSPGSRWHSSS